jgi:hypothetical protein
MEELSKAYKILFGKPEGKRPLRILAHTWESNVEMDLKLYMRLFIRFILLRMGTSDGLL